MLDKVQKFFIK